MIQKINPTFCRPCNLNFKGKNIYTEQDSNVKARQAVRDHIEKEFDATYHFPGEFNSKTIDQLKAQFRFLSSANAGAVVNLDDIKLTETKVDEARMKTRLGGYYCNCKRKNELYSGPVLERVEGGVETAKLAGFNSIVALEREKNSEYGNKVRREGMNFIGLGDIGNKTLHVFSIIHTQHRPDILFNLIEHPEEWATMNKDGTKKEHIDKSVSDIQDFIDILDGKNEDYPLPMYFGCQQGSNRTYFWNLFYNILKNEDRTEPLRPEIIQRLIEFDRETWDCYY